MKIAIVGAGFTGLSSAYQLCQKKHQVFIFEKEAAAGGLAGTFKLPNWLWHLEKHYHHWFTNDSYALTLIEKLGLKKHLIFPCTLTSIYFDGKSYAFNSPFDVLTFLPLTLSERIRTGLVLAFLKLLPLHLAYGFEKYTACEWLKKWFGKHSYQILWEPLLLGKFGPPAGGFAKTVNMAWFWARIKKRTQKLGYLEEGYQKLVEEIMSEIKRRGGKFYFGTEFTEKQLLQFDKVIVTTPSPVFTKMFPQLPEKYKKQLNNITHLHAFNLLLVTKEKILPDVYWLNINDRKFPFIAIVQQTNLIDAKYYSNQHIAWVANYLPPDHPYLNKTAEELFSIYLPYLKRINPAFNFKFEILNLKLFKGPFAQPVFPVNYSLAKPDFITPLPNVYLANMDMVYPWDRGTNYAIELGYKVAEYVITQ